MVDEHELELSDDKLAYLCRCMAEDTAPIINKLRAPYFQQFICQLIEYWCDHYGEDEDFCIRNIHGLAMIRRFMNNKNGTPPFMPM